MWRKATLTAVLVFGGLFLLFGESGATQDVKIGFVVKQPEEPWFQDEWRFAQRAADEKNFSLVRIGAPDGEKLMTAIDNLAAQKAQGMIVCVPNVNLGPAVVAKTRLYNMKLMTVDDRLIGAKGAPIESVPHMGISAYNIGKIVGKGIFDEMQARGWDPAETRAMRMTFYQLPTAKARTTGATDALVARGFLKGNFVDAPHKNPTTEEAYNAANVTYARFATTKKWVVFGMNDETVIGGVRALEGNGVPPKNIIGIGIGGSRSGINEFKQGSVTGFWATVIISPLRHGYETAVNMYNWIAHKKAPPALILTAGVLATAQSYKRVRAEMGFDE